MQLRGFPTIQIGKTILVPHNQLCQWINQNISNWNISQKNITRPKNIFAGCDIKEEYKPLKFQKDEKNKQ